MNSFHKQLLFIILGVAIIATGALGIRAVANRGASPVAYWKFDEGYASTTYDQSNNSNDGTLTGGVQWQNEEQCKTGKCLYFDGDNDYVRASPISGAPNRYATLSVWFNPSVLGQNIVQIAGFRYGGYTNGPLSIRMDSDDTILVRLVYTDGTYSDLTLNSTITNAGKWYHVVIVRDNLDFTAYVDGVFDKSRAAQDKDLYTATGFDIGFHEDGSNFNGKIDNVKIYDYARTASQIKSDYTASAGGRGAGVAVKSAQEFLAQSDGLVGYWKMDEASWDGTTGEVIDSSGSGNHGTAVNQANTTSTAKYGMAGTFDGTGDYVNLGTPSSLDPSGDMTIEAWINGVYGAAAYRHIYDDLNDLSFSVYDSKLAIYTDPNGAWWNSDISLTDNQWHHAVFTYEGVTQRLYLDGVERGSKIATGNWSLDVTDTKYISASSNEFNGQIDDVKIYNKARSASQIRKDYDTGPPPVAHWKMDKQDNTYAYDTAGSNDGTLNFNENGATSTKWVSGKYGSALQFDGSDDYVSASDSATLDIVGPMTVGAWVKLPVVPDDYDKIACKYGDGTHTFFLQFFANRTASFLAKAGGSATESTSVSVLALNTWYYITGVYDGSTQKIYINGVVEDTDNKTGVITPNSADLTMGALTGGGSYHFNGSIDDVRIYNYARTQKQIMQDMNVGHPAVGSPVGSYVGYWKFDEGYASTTYDMSISQNNGTLTGGVQWTQSGKFGSAVNIDGINDYISMGNPTSLQLTSDFTISSWINLDNIAASYNRGIVSKFYNTATNRGYRVGVIASSGLLALEASVDGTASVTVASKNAVSTNVWTHVSVAYRASNGEADFYIDGILDTVGTGLPTSIYNVGQNFGVGTWDTGTGDHSFIGSIDEVKIYPFALTPEEIKQEYDGGASLKLGSLSTPPTGGAGAGTSTDSSSIEYCVPGGTDQCDPPVAHWKFDKLTGQTAYDTAGNNDGTLGTSTAAQGEDPTHRNSAYCKVGNCLSFDGTDDYVDGGTIGALSTFTIEGWFKQDATGNQKWIGIAESSDDSAPTWIGSGNNAALTEWDAGVNSMSNNGIEVTGTDWHYYVLIYNGANGIAYKDGVSKGSIGNASVSYTNAKVHIGKRAWDDSGYFNGLADDIKIYNYVRTPAQIAWDYNRGGPIGWWKMDEGQDTATTCDATGHAVYDYSGNGNTGDFNSLGSPATTTSWVEGKYGCALDFDGTNDYVNGGGAEVLGLTGGGSMTASAWIKPDSLSGDQIIVQENGPFIFSIEGSKLGDSAALIYTGTWTGTTGNTDLIVDNWYHYTMVYDSSFIRLYLNGVEDGSVAKTGNLAGTGWLLFGAYSTGAATPTANWFDGTIDDVRIYNYALTPSQIRNVYNSGSAVRFGPTDGLP